MPSHVEAVFDIPQNRLSTPPAFYQDMRGYDDQQIRGVPRRTRLVGAGAGGYVLAYVYDHPQPQKDFTEQLRALYQHYTILDDDHILSKLLATDPALYSLLIEAVEPLRRAFGDKRLIYVRVQSSDEDTILKVTVRLPANFGNNPESALQTFDEEWWLNNCHRSSGALVFDYEMQNAV